jgi:hypothetical protein
LKTPTPMMVPRTSDVAWGRPSVVRFSGRPLAGGEPPGRLAAAVTPTA